MYLQGAGKPFIGKRDMRVARVPRFGLACLWYLGGGIKGGIVRLRGCTVSAVPKHVCGCIAYPIDGMRDI